MRDYNNKYAAGLRFDHVGVGALLRICPGKKHAWFEGSGRPVRKPIVKGMSYRTAQAAAPAEETAGGGQLYGRE